MRKFRTTICLSPADLVQILYCVLSLEFCLLLFRFPAEKKKRKKPETKQQKPKQKPGKKREPLPPGKNDKKLTKTNEVILVALMG